MTDTANGWSVAILLNRIWVPQGITVLICFAIDRDSATKVIFVVNSSSIFRNLLYLNTVAYIIV